MCLRITVTAKQYVHKYVTSGGGKNTEASLQVLLSCEEGKSLSCFLLDYYRLASISIQFLLLSVFLAVSRVSFYY